MFSIVRLVSSHRWSFSGPVRGRTVRPVRTAPLLLALAVAGCASTVSGTGSARLSPNSDSSRAAPSSAPATTAAPTSPPVLTPAGLGERLRAAAVREHSAHVDVVSGGLGGRADEQLDGGTVTALHVVQSVGAGVSYEIIAVGRRAWVHLPAFYSTHARWVIVSRSSPVTPARNLAGALSGVRATASPATAAGYVSEAASVRVLGRRTVDGTATTAYAVLVVASRLPPGSPLRAQLAAAGLDKVTLELDADANDRLVRFAAQGISVTWSHLDEPVHIAPPPAAQTGRS